MEVLQVENLTFHYPDAAKPAVDGVSLQIEDGEFIVVCGQSGCGKTTLLRLLKKELAPEGKTEGTILYRQTPLSDVDQKTSASGIGYVLQNPDSQIVTDEVWHELAFGLENLGVPTGVIRRRVGEMASYFGIQDWFHKKTDALSGGQKQLLNLASVMVMQPKILILDEPTSQLDPIAAADFIATLQKLNRELGLTILLAEHRLEEVFPVADRVLLMEDGKALLFDTPRNIGMRLHTLRDDHPMLLGLPSAVRIYHALECDRECPLTVREGRKFLETYCAEKNIDTDMQKQTVNMQSAEAGVQKQEANRKNTEAGMRKQAANMQSADAGMVKQTADMQNKKKTREKYAVELKEVWFRYEKNLPDVLRGVTLQVAQDELFCLLGGNAAGKTTLLNVISGLDKAYRGKVLIDGRVIREYRGNSLYRNMLAYLPQNPLTVFMKDTVRADFMELLQASGIKKTDCETRIGETARKIGITAFLDKHPYDLSGGEQQKCALAKILLTEPRILLLDEPTKGLDAYAKSQLRRILRDLQAEGMTILLVTHDVEFAAQTADRCALFFDGEVLSADTPTAFFSENNFYTTAANRMARGLFPQAVTCEQVVSCLIGKQSL